MNEQDLFTLNERQQNEENNYNFKYVEKMSFNTYNQPEAPNAKTSNAMSPNKKIKDVITEYNLSLR